MIPRWLRHGWEMALDIVYPPTCAACAAPGSWFCEACLRSIPIIHAPLCARCGAIRTRDHVCEGKWFFDAVLSCGPYQHRALRTLVTSFKYHSAHCLRGAFQEILQAYTHEHRDPWPWAGLSALSIIPIPTDADRVRARGMDHAHILADLVQNMIVPWATVSSTLCRIRSAPPNAKLPSDHSRTENIRDVFAMQGAISGAVLLVDDVVTTGATANEAARVVREAGATHVFLFTMTKGSSTLQHPKMPDTA